MGSGDGASVFRSEVEAYEYMVEVAERDLQYRGFRDERVWNFAWRQEANFLLYRRVALATDSHEMAALRARWESVHRPEYRAKVWSPEQADVLAKIKVGVSYEDEATRLASSRWLYIAGAPGSGKSAVLLAAALDACKSMQVRIVCPTGALVYSFKSRLPDTPGVENIRVDTIHGVLAYKRPGADGRVQFAPPSALRRIDLFLVDEASQYDDREWENFWKSILEQPHAPFVCVVGDFQQLQPLQGGGFCRRTCACMQQALLSTVYRSTDEEHLVFLNRIRETQPTRDVLQQYFAGRHWLGVPLQTAVAEGMRVSEDRGEPFTWLCCTNWGASDVCRAALLLLGCHLASSPTAISVIPPARASCVSSRGRGSCCV